MSILRMSLLEGLQVCGYFSDYLENCFTSLYLASPDLCHLLFSSIQMYLYSWMEFLMHIGSS